LLFFSSDAIGEKDSKKNFTDNEARIMDLLDSVGVIKNVFIYDGEKLAPFMSGVEVLRENKT
jgi:hypothetical protein